MLFNAQSHKRLCASVCLKTFCLFNNGVSSVACFVGFASCKTFNKQPKRPCFGQSPRTGRQPFVPLHHATALFGCLYASLHNGFVRLTASILAWSRGGSPSNIAPARMPGVYAARLCRTQSQPSIHSPLPRGRGLEFRQGCRDRTPKGFAGRKAHKAFL